MSTDQKNKYIYFATILISIAPIIVILYCFNTGINGNDFWWHVKVGEYIIENRTVPVTDIFSWYGMSKGIDWTAHEWLADVVFYVIHSLFGNLGIYILALCGAVLLYVLLWHNVKKYIEENILVTGVFFVLFAVITSMFFYGRPHIFSYFLLFFELKYLYEFWENNDSKKIYLIPLLAVLWSNLHGGSSNLAYIICIIFMVAGVIKFKFERIEFKPLPKKALIKLIAVTVASVVGIMINPIGLKVLTYPYINLSDNLSMSVISEWQAPDAKNIGDLILYFFPIFLMTIGIVSDDKKVRLIDLLVMLAFLFLFFRSARFIVLWYIAASHYAFRYMPKVKIKDITSLYEKLAVWLCAIVMVVPVVISVKDIYSLYKDDKLIKEVMMEEAVEAVKANPAQRIYNDYNLGEALIYNDIPVFFDARADLYAQENIMADGISMALLQQADEEAEKPYVDVDELLEKYEFDAILTLKVRALYTYVISHPEQFEYIYEDDTVAYYRVIRE